MTWNSIVRNHRGFIHHPDTPPDDKEFYFSSYTKALQLMEVGKSFIESDGVFLHRRKECGKKEIGTNSKFLHRGFYCPSPVLDIIISNAKRGRLLTKPNTRYPITNRYVFDTSGLLIYLDTFDENKMTSSEYLLYRENVVYGVTVGMNGKLLCVSEEVYSQNRLESYSCNYYTGDLHCLECYKVECEVFTYDCEGLTEWNFYTIRYDWEKVAPSGYIDHKRYRFARENGFLKSATLVYHNGVMVEYCCPKEIKITRKA